MWTTPGSVTETRSAPQLLRPNITIYSLQDCPDGSDETNEVCQAVVGKKEKVVAEKFAVKEEEEVEEREGSNPCSRWPPVCGQVCISGGGEGGSHRCDCVQGYVQDPQDSSQCKPSEGHPSILFAHKSDVRKLSLDRPSMTAIVNNTRLNLSPNTLNSSSKLTKILGRSSCAVDFHFKTGMIFWSDVRDERIYK